MIKLYYVLAIALADIAVVNAATVVVDAGGGGSSTTINGGIALANAMDTVQVNAGNYIEDVVVNKSVSVVANGVVDVSSPGASVNRTVFSVQAADVTIEGFRITVGLNTACGISVRGTGTASTRNNAHILNNEMLYVNSTGQSAAGGGYTAFGANACGISTFEPTGNGFSTIIRGNKVGTAGSPFPQFGIYFDRVKGEIGGSGVGEGNQVYGEEFALEARFFANNGSQTTTTIEGNTFFGWGNDNNKGSVLDIGHWPANSFVVVRNNVVDSATGLSPKLGKSHQKLFQIKNYYGGEPGRILVEGNIFNVRDKGLLLTNVVRGTVASNTFNALADNAILLEVNNKIYSSGVSHQDPQGLPGLSQNNAEITGNDFNAAANNVTAIEFRDHTQSNTAANGAIEFNKVTLGGTGSAANYFDEALAYAIRLNPDTGSTFNHANYPQLAVGSTSNMIPFANDLLAGENMFEVGGVAKLPADMNPTELTILAGELYEQSDDANLGRIQLADSPVVIAAVSSVDGTSDTAKEYVLIANHTADPVDISGWELRVNGGGGSIVTPLSGTIPAYAHFLVANYGTAASVEGTGVADQEVISALVNGTSETSGVSISLYNGSAVSAVEIDGFSFGGGATSPETLGELPSFLSTVADPAINSYVRNRPGNTSGPYIDTNNNYSDLSAAGPKAPARDIGPEGTTAVDSWLLYGDMSGN